MRGPNRDGWLLAAGVAYPIAAFGALIGFGPFALGTLAVTVPPLLLASGVVVARQLGVPLRWPSVALFVLWLAAVTFGVLFIMAAASAAV